MTVYTLMDFKKWLLAQEDANLGGLEPPQERPVDAAVGKSSGAFNRRSLTHDDEPPTPEHPWMSKHMKKRMPKKMVAESEKRTAAKTPLYPPAYGGINLYPDLYYMPIAADHAYYMSIDPMHHHRDKIRVWQKHHGKKPS